AAKPGAYVSAKSLCCALDASASQGNSLPLSRLSKVPVIVLPQLLVGTSRGGPSEYASRAHNLYNDEGDQKFNFGAASNIKCWGLPPGCPCRALYRRRAQKCPRKKRQFFALMGVSRMVV